SRVLDIMRTQVLHESNFDAAVATRTFTINTPDIGEMVFLPKLLKRLSTVAPSIRLRATTVPHEQLETALETGKVDLAVGYFPDLTKAEIFQQRLFSHSFVCVVREDHPKVPGNRLSMKQFLDLAHMVVYVSGRSHEIFEYLLHQRGIRRKIALETRHFMSLPMIIEESDLVATVPRAVGVAYSRFANLKLLELPMAVPQYDLKQYWHRRFHRDGASVWFRNLITDLFRE